MIKRDKKLLTIEVNFGKQIMEILAEVQVLKKDFPDKIIPKPAEDVFTKYDSFRQYNNRLEKIVELYNDLRLNCIPEEFKLIEEEMASLDNDLQPAENTLTWHSTEIKVFKHYQNNPRINILGLYKWLEEQS